MAYTFLYYCAVVEGVPQRGVGHHRQHRPWSVRGGPGEHWAAEVRLGHGDHGDNHDNITVTLLVEQFHCRSDPRLKEMLAKFNIYVENVGGGSVSLKNKNNKMFA